MLKTTLAAALLFAATSMQAAFTLTSPAVSEGGTLPEGTVLDALDCRGPNRSPALQWSDAPPNTQSFVVLLDDYEARLGDGFIHWAAYNIPASAKGLAENAGASDLGLPPGARHAYSDFLQRNYGGPCPPAGPPHKYRFTVIALDISAIDDAGTPMTWRKLRVVIHGHVLAQASLNTLYGRKESMTTEQTIAALDTEYQLAVEKNDVATMDRILADDFMLITGAGKQFTKKDLLDEAKSGHIVYEHQRDTNQTVRVWGDTAVITALLSAKGTDEGKPFAYRVWFSDTYVRTPGGWRYVLGQSGGRLEPE
jgi:Raf kinase inhibitor-like YbhB/YbcL family protein